MKSNRVHGFDILRIATVMAILYFHVWQYTFYQDVISIPPEVSNYHNLTGWVGDMFKYGGLFIVALSYFLIGLKKHSNHSLRIFVLLAGIWSLQIITSDEPMNPSSWDWDVYSYLIITYLLVLALPKAKWIRAPLAIISALILCIPFDLYESVLKIQPSVQFSGWGLMPWTFLAILFHSVGVLWRQSFPDLFSAIRKWEWPLWIIPIVILFIVTPDYGPFPAGPGFESYVFKIKPLMFWKHFLVFTFLMRLSLDGRVNTLLAKIKGMDLLGKIEWNKHLGVSYFMHLAFLPLGQHWMDVWASYPILFDWFWLFIFVSVHFIVMAMFYGREMIDLRVRKAFTLRR
ncbi:hypothetical protein [Bdellovibrio sp. HCB209]|uniref:hypothetical protein n=1 Tax=Bdellovibrio sp. HCB209 TaxID=3394354 RepID=UPI0039B40A09